MKGLNENDSLEKLDLSDNSITDTEGVAIIRYIKQQAEKRENSLWMTGLRHSNGSFQVNNLLSQTANDKSYRIQNVINSPDTQL
jgi:hypothetical protein